jgi:transmembrane sensor
MRYPVAFGARNRAVELTGEGYFEVTHNPNRPFAVTSGEQTVLVLGTGFNVNAYPDEKPITTLVHGSVKISTPVVSKILKPREQSVISGNDINIATTDVKTATAWKEGLFVFKDETMRNISKQIARWYNVDVDYKNDIPYHFNATIERKEPLENFLQLLAKTNNVHFTLVNNRLTISP